MDPRQPADRIPVILVVDDDPVARAAMCGYLRDTGYAVREADGGADALALFDERGADAVLLDWRMPGKSGAEVLPRIAAQDPTVPVIVVSGTSEVRELARALRMGAWDFVIKPIEDMAVLDRALVRCLLRAELLREQGRRRETLEDLVRRRTEDLEEANRRLRREIAERGEYQRALAESEERFRQLMESTNEVFWVRDLAGDRLLYLSPAYETVWGRPVEDAMRTPATSLDTVHPEDRDGLRAAMVDIAASATPVDAEFRILRPDGQVRWVHARAFPVRDGDGRVYRVAGVAEDVTARRRAEESIRASLREKEILLREVHHRVKNNLQLIVSLLNLQAAYADGAADRERFIESRNRVASMALAHEELYRANDLASVNFADYVERLARRLVLASVDAEVELALDLPPLFLPVSAAIPCGLILNELVTNATGGTGGWWRCASPTTAWGCRKASTPPGGPRWACSWWAAWWRNWAGGWRWPPALRAPASPCCSRRTRPSPMRRTWATGCRRSRDWPESSLRRAKVRGVPEPVAGARMDVRTRGRRNPHAARQHNVNPCTFFLIRPVLP